jgi:hypothetical protein
LFTAICHVNVLISEQVREVFADGSLGPIETRKKGPGGMPPPVATSKYKQCSSEELLQKIEHFRAELEFLESKRMNRDAQNKQHPIKLPKKSKIQLRMARKELRELQRELKARAAPADQQLPSGDGAGGGAGGGEGDDAALGVSSSDDEDDDEEEGDDA